MNNINSILSAEDRFLIILEKFFRETWGRTLLSSHDLDHHRRVWLYARELLGTFKYYSVNTLHPEPAKLIIACYLHDLGMSADTGISHGKTGRELCEKFLIKNSLSLTDYQEVLQAIENHDNKESFNAQGKNDVLTLLTVADDLDAFDYTGVYRYLEIYSIRKILPQDAGYLIRKNARIRYKNLLDHFGGNQELIEKHSRRYRKLDNFFLIYNNESDSYSFGTGSPSGCCGVYDIVAMIGGDNSRLQKILKEPDKFTKDHVILEFLNGLNEELKDKHIIYLTKIKSHK